MKKKIGFLLASVVLASSAFAQSASTASPFNGPVNQALYVKGGFPGVGVGYAYGVNPNFGIRVDVTTLGSHSVNEESGNLNYNGSLKYNQAGLYGDWFPSANNFRLSAGLQFRNAHIRGEGRPNSLDVMSVGDVDVLVDSGDSLHAQIKFPKVAPYIGIGWGLNTAANSKGWSVFADLGATLGKPKVSMYVNDSLSTKLDAATGGNGQDEINKQVATLRSDTNKWKLTPQLFVGVAYKF